MCHTIISPQSRSKSVFNDRSPSKGQFRLGLIVVLVLMMGLAGNAAAVRTIYDAESRETILAVSDAVFLAHLQETSTRWQTPDQKMIATDNTFFIEEVIYNSASRFADIRQGNPLSLTFAGGTLGDNTIQFTDVPTFDPDEIVILLIQDENVGSISPLVGVHRGLYRVRKENGALQVYDAFLNPITVPFFSTFPEGGGTPMELEEFLADLRSAVTRAHSDPSLLPQTNAQIPEQYRDKVFTGDQIPHSVPDNTARPASTRGRLPRREPDGTDVPEAGANPENSDLDGEGIVNETGTAGGNKYAFLWGPPNLPSIFNVPPIYDDPAWGPNFEYSLSSWNRYASDVFRVYSTPENTFGHNDRNDFAFTTDSSFNSVYGFTPSSGWLGIAVMFNSSGNNISPGEQIFEADVILSVNPGLSWTLDFQTGYWNNNIWYFRSTAVHEIGHVIGREHQFTDNLSAQWHSVMNYPPSGAIDTEFYLPYMDDAQSIRAAYPANTVPINDMGVYLYRTNGNGSSSPVPVQFSTFPSSAQQGESFQVSNYAIENLGTTTVTPVIEWYLTTEHHTYAGDEYFLGDSTFGSLGTFSYYNASSWVTVPTHVPPGNYWISAYAQSDDFNSNRSAWTRAQILIQEQDPECDVSTTSLFFNVGTIGGVQTRQFTITNVGGGTLSGSVFESCSEFSVFPGSYSLGAGQSVTVSVTYSPDDCGDDFCTIQTGGLCDNVSCETSGPDNQECTVSPTALAFNVPAIGGSDSQTFTISNTGCSTLSGSLSESCPEFSLSQTGYILLPGQSANIIVTYTPTNAGDDNCLIFTGGLCSNVTCTATGPGAAAVSVFSIPDGSGAPLSAASTFGGAPVNATITVNLGSAGIPAVDVWLETTLGGLVSCTNGTIADGPTSGSGVATFSNPVRAGGHTNPAGGERTIVVYNGSPVPGQEYNMQFNSPDLDGDLVVNLVDVAIFSADYFGSSVYRSDFKWDGVYNLNDIALFAPGLSKTCPMAAAAVVASKAQDQLGIYFDRSGNVSAASAPVNEPTKAYLVARGPVADLDLRGWECQIETSENIEVVSWTLPEKSLNFAEPPSFIVAGAAPFESSDSQTVTLMTIEFVVKDGQPAHLALDPKFVNTGGSAAPLCVFGKEEFGVRPLEIATNSAGHSAAHLNDPKALAETAPMMADLDLHCAPNPFNPITDIRFNLAREGDVVVTIYNIAGQMVRKIEAGKMPAGPNAVRWDGRDRAGSGSASGLYFCQLRLDGAKQGPTLKMSLVR